MTSSQARLRIRVRNAIPEWLKQRLIPFECELERLASEFCSVHSGEGLLDVAGGSAAYAEGRLCIDIDFDSLRRRTGLRICADAHHLPVRRNSIDAVCCSAALHHFEDPGRSLAQMRECLKSGGELFLSVPFRFPRIGMTCDYHRFKRKEIVGLLEATGWRVILCTPVGGRYWVLSRTILEQLFQWCGGFRLLLFLPAAPFLGFLVPLCCFYLDRGDRAKECTLGWIVIASKET